jgi:hypothetical protein
VNAGLSGTLTFEASNTGLCHDFQLRASEGHFTFDDDEVKVYATDALSSDSDGATDGEEVAGGSNPLIPDVGNAAPVPALAPVGHALLAMLLVFATTTKRGERSLWGSTKA